MKRQILRMTTEKTGRHIDRDKDRDRDRDRKTEKERLDKCFEEENE